MSDPNQFRIVREVPFAELEEKLREVTLLNQPDVHPYEGAQITIERFTWDTVLPTSKYVLSAGLDTQRDIRASIAPHGLDQLELEGGLVIDGSEKGPQSLTPPIVERFEADGKTPYVLDGSHRTNLGRFEGRESFLALFIRGIRKDCPPYAFPNLWSEVVEMVELPQDLASLKNYREYDDRYRLYRDFGPLNGSEPRRPKGQ
jgi:hypothetical protein